ncbi:MAG: nucleoside deaminase [Kiritimatiellae bacterium]|nr:nucleoside deaminase [Kiritimatiellia bacterium]
MPLNMPTELQLSLPPWMRPWLRAHSRRRFADVAARMEVAVELATHNVARRTGGPFGAAVFDRRDGRLIAAGVNLVVAARGAHWHAEVVALALAQRRLRTHDLAAAGDYELVTSVEPCLMCLGATLASGVRSLVCGARGADAEAIGFDEGPKPTHWSAELRRRGLAVQRDVKRPAARRVLRDYAAAGGPIYLAQRGA